MNEKNDGKKVNKNSVWEYKLGKGYKVKKAEKYSKTQLILNLMYALVLVCVLVCVCACGKEKRTFWYEGF